MVGCSNDDTAGCCGVCGEFKVVVPIPVYGRLPLLKQTIKRLYEKNKVHKVICVGHEPADKKVCEEMGAEFVTFSNRYLGAKWNAGFQAAKKYNPDACLFIGSSDWICEDWIQTLRKRLLNTDLVGLPGCYFLDISESEGYRACHWPGYKGDREGESIGIGRLIRASMLEKLDWKPFDPHLKHSLDYSMVNRVKKAGGRVTLLINGNIKSLSISTDHWPNKHQFSDHFTNKLPSKRLTEVDLWIDQNFPEAKHIFK